MNDSNQEDQTNVLDGTDISTLLTKEDDHPAAAVSLNEAYKATETLMHFHNNNETYMKMLSSMKDDILTAMVKRRKQALIQYFFHSK